MEIEIYWETSPKLETEELHRLSETVLNLAGMLDTLDFFIRKPLPEPLCLNVIFTDDPQIQSMNSTYRDKNTATDVLTFPFDPVHSPAENKDRSEVVFKNPPSEELPSYAEIYISQDTAIRQSKEQNLTLFHEFIILIVHGMLHAFHYDHETSASDKAQMSSCEKNVLSRLGMHSIAPLTVSEATREAIQ